MEDLKELLHEALIPDPDAKPKRKPKQPSAETTVVSLDDRR
jgi:hypothetical protein